MKYDFVTKVDRTNTGSIKWDEYGVTSPEFAPLSVADMEFVTPKEISSALAKTANEKVLGYTTATDEYRTAVVNWMKRRHDFDVRKDWILMTPGVVPALAILIEAVTKPCDGVILLTPVYYPFDMAVIAKTRHVVYSVLKNVDGRYEIDFADLEKKAKDPKNTAILFCNPHNPVGRVWTKEELEKVGKICTDNGVFIIDDEIHNDLIMPGVKHTVFANISEKVRQNIAVCTAPSKTFNLAGLQCSNIIIPNDEARAKANAIALVNVVKDLNVFAYPACISAYNECEGWLEELISVIADNAKTSEEFFKKNFPSVVVSKLEGTYLQWIDFRALGLTHVELKKALIKHKVYFDYGEMFGDAGRGFERINLACPKDTLLGALERVKSALDEKLSEIKNSKEPRPMTLRVGDKVNFVYTKADGTTVDLESESKKSTFIAFLRFAECDVTKTALKGLKTLNKIAKLCGRDIKAVIQSDAETVKEVQKDFAFELIPDVEGKLYDRYNVFEANSMFSMVAGDKYFEDMIGDDIKKMVSSDMFKSLAKSLIGGENEHPERRGGQLLAFFTFSKNGVVKYAHYAKTIGDIPPAKELVGGMLK